MQKSYNDPVKQKARLLFTDFINKNLQKSKKKVHVLCFPGAEQEGEEGLELQVYDSLGIPRENITGLEIDTERYERLRKSETGINLYHESDIEFLKKARERGLEFDVINMDYTSYYNHDRIYALELIANDGLLGKKGILGTNYLARREDKRTQRMHSLNDNVRNHIEEYYEATKNNPEKLKELGLRLSDTSNFEIGSHRSKIVRTIINSTMINGKGNLSMDYVKNVLNWAHGKGGFYRFLRLVVSELKKSPQSYEEILSFDGRNYEEKIQRSRVFRLSKSSLLQDILNRIRDFGPLNIILFHIINTRPYFVVKDESYSYVSNSGSPMIYDLTLVDSYSEKTCGLDNFYEMQNEPRLMIINRSVKSVKKRNKKLQRAKKAAEFLNEKFGVNRKIPERIFIGSSYNPRTRNKRITKEDAFYLLSEGVPPREIAETYEGFTKMQLAAFKAHMTMGTYEKP